MKRKRLLCAVMALVLLFSAQPAAFASNAGNMRSTVITASTRMPVIRVSIPSRGTVYVNPYKLPVSINGEDSDEQVVSVPTNIANSSEVPIEVEITLIGAIKLGSDMSLAGAPTHGTGTEKEAFVYFEIQQSNSEDPEDVTWDAGYDASKHAVVLENVVTTYPVKLTLPQTTRDGDISPGGYAPFRLAGDAVKNPTNPWTKKDGINVTITYKITPLPYPAS